MTAAAPGDSPGSRQGGRAVLTLPGWARFLRGGARSWTLGSPHERSPQRAAGAVPAPPRQPDFPFPLREMQPLPYVGVGGARSSSAAALLLCLRAGPRPRGAPGEVWAARPGCSRQGYSRENRREGAPPSLSGSGSVVHPRPPMRFGGTGTRRCLCWPPPGNSRAWSPPGARTPSASPPTAGESRRTPRSRDPAGPGSSCCSFLHPTEPSGTQSRAGWLYPHAPDIQRSGFITSCFRATDFYLIPAWMHSPPSLPSTGMRSLTPSLPE